MNVKDIDPKDEQAILKFDDFPEEIQIKRNEITLTLKKAKTTRGDNPGRPFYRPEITEENFPDYCTWAKQDDVLSILNARERQQGINTAAAVTIEDGTAVYWNKFLKGMEERTVAAETKSSLLDTREELRVKLEGINLGMVKETDPAKQAAMLQDAIKLIEKSGRISEEIDRKTRERKPRTTKAAVADANAAATDADADADDDDDQS